MARPCTAGMVTAARCRARQLAQPVLSGKKYLIHDRDPLFTAKFLEMLAATGIESVKLPPKSPNLNAYAERFVRTIKESCLEKMIWLCVQLKGWRVQWEVSPTGERVGPP